MTDPMTEYGILLGTMKRGMEEMARRIVAGFQIGYEPAKVDPEALRIRAYQRRIQRERELGLAFVRNEARRARRELGLPPR